MVATGQFLERPTLIPVGDHVLEGLSHRGKLRPSVLIIPPRPEEGGMDHVVAAELAWKAAMAGHPTLRFNYSGVGASQGARGAFDSWVADGEAALRVVEENAGHVCAIIVALEGSARVALELTRRSPTLLGVCLISPLDLPPEELLRQPVGCRVIIAEGDLRLPRAALSAAVAESGGALEIIEGADRAFMRNLPSVGKSVLEWIRGFGLNLH